MDSIRALFHRRIGLPEDWEPSFDRLDEILQRMALRIPFENLRILADRIGPITKRSLADKILSGREGGLCYEINPILYYYLKETGFDASLTNGVVYNEKKQAFLTLGRTHVAILLKHEGETFLVDAGFGGNLPLKPVPLSGRTVSSENGEFRAAKKTTEHGDYVLEMKLKHKDPDWKTGYAFDSRRPEIGPADLDAIQTTIARHEESPFNRTPLVTMRTLTGHMTLTSSSFTVWENGQVSKEEMDAEHFGTVLRRHFGLTFNR
ncbi:arylamine N-acetyltransferase family protein [Cohnella caldifontis]|uniref:arylamine N-acetyltransferase family protein n=1 Tax=Cohnella caldifontis TaxID=3027471 RepID=UPI0023EC8583|nr:arylamine N-acetyltransferase [Cohnella sp. YIM B05605]